MIEPNSDQKSTQSGTETLNQLVDGLDYPMFIVTTTDGRDRAGCLVGFVTQASINPARLLVCVSVNNHTSRVAARASMLAVHALAATQRDLAELFGSTTGDEVDKFAKCSWKPGPHGLPVLTDCPRWLVGRVLERIPLGDHVGHLLEPVESRGQTEFSALTYQQLRQLVPGHPA